MPTKRRSMRGAGFLGDAFNKVKTMAKQVALAGLKVAKERRVLSGALKSAGYNNVAEMAKNAGYGRKRAAPRRRRAGKGAIGSWVGSTLGGIAGGFLPGFGRRRRGRGQAGMTDMSAKVLLY